MGRIARAGPGARRASALPTTSRVRVALAGDHRCSPGVRGGRGARSRSSRGADRAIDELIGPRPRLAAGWVADDHRGHARDTRQPEGSRGRARPFPPRVGARPATAVAGSASSSGPRSERCRAASSHTLAPDHQQKRRQVQRRGCLRRHTAPPASSRRHVVPTPSLSQCATSSTEESSANEIYQAPPALAGRRDRRPASPGSPGYVPEALPGAVSFSSACSGLKNTRSTTTASTVPSGRSTSSSTASALWSTLTIAKPMFLSSRGE